MKEIRDMPELEKYAQQYHRYFQQRPPVLKLVEFEKGAFLQGPFQPLNQFLILVKGSVSIYHLTQEGSIRYVSRAGVGTLLGDVEFSGAEQRQLYAEAAETVRCLAMPFRENQAVLEKDPVFLRFVLSQLARKLSVSAQMDVSAQTLEEKVLFYLETVQPDREIASVNQALQQLHCSRRQLQRVVKKLCGEGKLVKEGRGHYRLNME